MCHRCRNLELVAEPFVFRHVDMSFRALRLLSRLRFSGSSGGTGAFGPSGGGKFPILRVSARRGRLAMPTVIMSVFSQSD